jgi:acid phosphatase
MGAFDGPLAPTTDPAGNTLLTFLVTPNEISDMHDGTIADGDSWLALTCPPSSAPSTRMADGQSSSPDEGEGGKAMQCATNTTDFGCHIATIVISPSTQPGTTSDTLFNHYSLLGTAEQLLGLPKLGLAATAPTLTSAFNL